MTAPGAGGAQRCVIEGWLPTDVANARLHWMARNRAHQEAKVRARSAALAAGWQFVPGRAHLTITLVFPVARTRDHDNAVARCKGVIDGLKVMFFADDDETRLRLTVRTVTQKGRTATELTLAPAGEEGD